MTTPESSPWTIIGSALKNAAKFVFRADNLFNILALAVAIYLGLKSAASASVADGITAVIIVLGCLAAAQLSVGYFSIQRDKAIEKLTNIGSANQSADLLLRKRDGIPRWAERLKGATHLDALGLSLNTLALGSQGELRELKERGGRIRLILVNPDNKAIHQLLAQRVVEVQGIAEAQVGDHHAGIARTALASLTALAGRLPNGGEIEVRVIDLFPTIAYVGVDTNTARGKISVEFYQNQVRMGRDPILYLDAQQDPYWYGEFKEQFELYWNSGHPAK